MIEIVAVVACFVSAALFVFALKMIAASKHIFHEANALVAEANVSAAEAKQNLSVANSTRDDSIARLETAISKLEDAKRVLGEAQQLRVEALALRDSTRVAITSALQFEHHQPDNPN